MRRRAAAFCNQTNRPRFSPVCPPSLVARPFRVEAFLFGLPSLGFAGAAPLVLVRVFPWVCLCFSSGRLAMPSANATHSVTSNSANPRRPRSHHHGTVLHLRAPLGALLW